MFGRSGDFMLKVTGLIAATAFLLLLVMPFASHTQAQMCLYRFARFEVFDAEGKRVPDVTIELLGEVPEEDFLALQAEARRREIHHPDVKLLPEEIEKVVKRISPMRGSGDVCGNPFKQRANSTRVKITHTSKASKENFGFCNMVGHNRRPLLLKISAPGYATDYHAGAYLSDCLSHKAFSMSKVEKLTKKQKRLL
jgi:hypothetical protein